MPTSNIDDLLLGGKTTTHPETPEHAESTKESQAMGDIEGDTPDYGLDEEPKTLDDPEQDGDVEDEPETKKPEKVVDEYGNEEEPVSDVIRDRLSRQARKYESEIEALRSQLAAQGASRDVQQAVKDFEYDPESSGDWQQQLAGFIKQTVKSMSDDQVRELQAREEAHIQHEFEGKFRQGLQKFEDFPDVIRALPFQISNHMTMATRSMSDPVAFLYAAAKRQPQELERISKIKDPYAQAREMGNLEERMRRNKPTTNAPRPPGRAVEDSSSPEPKKKSEPTIEDLIARADAKKLAKRKVMPRMGRR